MRKLAGVLTLVLAVSLIPASGARAARTVTIRGGGWGHGLGMSQYGAYGRALNGKGARAILKHYYTGVSVARRDMPGSIRVGLLQYRKSISISSNGKVVWKVAGSSGSVATGGSSVSWRVEPSPTGGIRLYRDGVKVAKDGKSVFGSPQKPLVLRFEPWGTTVRVAEKNNSYALGRMQLGTHPSDACGGYCLRLVIVLGMQKYLYGLGEVPSSWPQATLRAQATAGRTYAYSKVRRSGQHREPCDCAVYDSVIDQAYIGDAKRTGSGPYWDDWKRAVDATSGVVILHGGEPIQALYSSSSGGHTENNENVWGDGTEAEAIPYLRGVPDRSDRARGRNPNHTWSLDMSYATFESKLDAAFGVGSVERFRVVAPRGVSERVIVVRPDNTGGVKIVGSKKTVRVDGWSIRSALGLKDTLFWVDISHDVGTRFEQKYKSLGGAPGDARSAVYGVPRGSNRPKGRAQNFDRGRMTWTRSIDKVVWQWGRVLRKYNRMGRERSVLGMPVSDVWGPGRYRGATYARGIIVWSNETGARTVRGRFLSAYRRNGSVKGPMGLPLDRRRKRATLPNGGRRQRFQNGALYQDPSGDVFALWGGIARRYRRMGEAGSRCGYPVGDQVATKRDAAARFRHGVITWSEIAGVTVSCD